MSSHKRGLIVNERQVNVICLFSCVGLNVRVFCHRTQEWEILKSVLKFRSLNETPFLFQVVQSSAELARGRRCE